MDAEKANYSISLMAMVLKVTRAGYYAWRKRSPQRARRVVARREFDMEVSDAFHYYDQTHGAPRLAVALRNRGIMADKKTVAKSLLRLGLQAVSTRAFYRSVKKDGPECRHPDRCKCRWDAGRLDRVWITDFTYLRTGEDWVYLVAIRDAHSKRVIGWAMGDRQNTDLIAQAIAMANKCRGGMF